ncbi:MAG TPA: efflux RND transporter periplasmic adaptor subunit [Gemmataceae bacterium]|nr:efflux RND transporter periplasmic adaptor subunit [Gemmataceae bacterium]
MNKEMSTSEHAKPASPPWWRGKLLWLGAVAAAFVVGWTLSGRSGHHEDKDKLPSETGGANGDSVMVTVEPVATRRIQRVVEGMGTLWGFEEITIAARVDGRVRKVCLDLGDTARPGDCFVEIDPTDHDLALKHAERALQVELAKLGLNSAPERDIDLKKLPPVVQAKARLENMRSKRDRAEALWQKKAVSEEDLINARTDVGVCEAEFENQVLMAKSGLATIFLKQAALAMQRQQFEDTKVRVPTPLLPVPDSAGGVEYIVSHRSVSEGTLVKPGTEIGKLVIHRTLKLRIPVPERYNNDVRIGQKADVASASTAKPVTGTVARVSPAVDPTTRTFDVEIQIPNSRFELKPGSFAKAAIRTQVTEKGTTVPLTAVVRFAGVTKIFLLENGKAKEVQVQTGAQTSDWIEITRPALPAESRVITSGHTVLADASPVIERTEKGAP